MSHYGNKFSLTQWSNDLNYIAKNTERNLNSSTGGALEDDMAQTRPPRT